MKRRVELRFEQDLLDRVDEAAELLGISRTALIKQACKAYLPSIRQNRFIEKGRN